MSSIGCGSRNESGSGYAFGCTGAFTDAHHPLDISATNRAAGAYIHDSIDTKFSDKPGEAASPCFSATARLPCISQLFRARRWHAQGAERVTAIFYFAI